jgi:hypothetical protein
MTEPQEIMQSVIWRDPGWKEGRIGAEQPLENEQFPKKSDSLVPGQASPALPQEAAPSVEPRDEAWQAFVVRCVDRGGDCVSTEGCKEVTAGCVLEGEHQ